MKENTSSYLDSAFETGTTFSTQPFSYNYRNQKVFSGKQMPGGIWRIKHVEQKRAKAGWSESYKYKKYPQRKQDNYRVRSNLLKAKEKQKGKVDEITC